MLLLSMHWQTILPSWDFSVMDVVPWGLCWIFWFGSKQKLIFTGTLPHPEALLSWISFIHQHPKEETAVVAVPLWCGKKNSLANVDSLPKISLLNLSLFSRSSVCHSLPSTWDIWCFLLLWEWAGFLLALGKGGFPYQHFCPSPVSSHF